MSNIICINCGSGYDEIYISRDMKSTRRCGVCQSTWTPDQDIEETDYKFLFNNESEISKDLRIKLAKKDEIIKELKEILDSFIDLSNKTSMTFSSVYASDLVNKAIKKIEELEK